MRRSLKNACLAVLRQRFGLNDFRPGQKAAVSCLLSGRDLLCILPTGAGKSLCWQLPAVMHRGLTVVVSPLLALMHDQVGQLRARGIPAISLDSLMSPGERQRAERDVRTGKARIVLVSPERLETPAFQRLCRDCPPWLLVVDEAHCVVQWGEEFRPSYSRIGAFLASLTARPVICAMTATADRRMQRQIIASLRMRRPKGLRLPVMRGNLRYRVVTTTNRTGAILRIAGQQEGKTVVFCRSRARAEQLAATLRERGLLAEHYHAGLGRGERGGTEERFRSGRTRILAATTAFGMGVDIPDVRCVIHDRLPDNVTDLVQQSGRAGRDGRDADCVILLAPAELIRANSHLNALHHALRWRPVKRWLTMRREWLPLRALLRACLQAPCIPAALAASLGQRAPRCGGCSACLRGPLVAELPDLPHQSGEELRLWLLRWQRNALAARRGIPPQTLMPDDSLHQAAEHVVVPPLRDVEAQRAMERLMAAIRRADMHEKEENGIP